MPGIPTGFESLSAGALHAEHGLRWGDSELLQSLGWGYHAAWSGLWELWCGARTWVVARPKVEQCQGRRNLLSRVNVNKTYTLYTFWKVTSSAGYFWYEVGWLWKLQTTCGYRFRLRTWEPRLVARARSGLRKDLHFVLTTHSTEEARSAGAEFGQLPKWRLWSPCIALSIIPDTTWYNMIQPKRWNIWWVFCNCSLCSNKLQDIPAYFLRWTKQSSCGVGRRGFPFHHQSALCFFTDSSCQAQSRKIPVEIREICWEVWDWNSEHVCKQILVLWC